MESYRFSSCDEAIKMLQKLKKQGKNDKIIVFTIDFDNDTESKDVATLDEGYKLVKKSETIIINEDLYTLLFCTLDDAPLVRLNDGVSAWIERSYANYLRLFEQFN